MMRHFAERSSITLFAVVLFAFATSSPFCPSAPKRDFFGQRSRRFPGTGVLYLDDKQCDHAGHNRLVNTNQSDTWTATYGTATSAGSIVVIRASNVFFKTNLLSGSSGPISIDTDSTSGIGGLTSVSE
jgi:hypothetical protein